MNKWHRKSLRPALSQYPVAIQATFRPHSGTRRWHSGVDRCRRPGVPGGLAASCDMRSARDDWRLFSPFGLVVSVYPFLAFGRHAHNCGRVQGLWLSVRGPTGVSFRLLQASSGSRIGVVNWVASFFSSLHSLHSVFCILYAAPGRPLVQYATGARDTGWPANQLTRTVVH